MWCLTLGTDLTLPLYALFDGNGECIESNIIRMVTGNGGKSSQCEAVRRGWFMGS